MPTEPHPSQKATQNDRDLGIATDFYRLPRAILADPALPNLAKLVWLRLNDFHFRKGYTWATHAAIGRGLGVSADSVSSALKCLIARGLVEELPSPTGRPNRYHLCPVRDAYSDEIMQAMETVRRASEYDLDEARYRNAGRLLAGEKAQHRATCPACSRTDRATQRRAGRQTAAREAASRAKGLEGGARHQNAMAESAAETQRAIKDRRAARRAANGAVQG